MPAEVTNFAAAPAEISLEFDDFELLPGAGSAGTPTLFCNFDDGASRAETGGVWTYNWPGAAGTAFDLVAPGRGGPGYAARVAGKLDGASSSNLQATFKSGGSPADLSSFLGMRFWARGKGMPKNELRRSEEHTSELQSRLHLVCRLLLEKKKNT